MLRKKRQRTIRDPWRPTTERYDSDDPDQTFDPMYPPKGTPRAVIEAWWGEGQGTPVSASDQWVVELGQMREDLLLLRERYASTRKAILRSRSPRWAEARQLTKQTEQRLAQAARDLEGLIQSVESVPVDH